MNLKTRVRLVALLYLMLAALLAGSLIYLDEGAKANRAQMDSVRALREQVVGLRSAGFEYIRWGQERPKAQAESAIANIRKLTFRLENQVSANEQQMGKQLSLLKTDVDGTELAIAELHVDRMGSKRTFREERSIELLLLKMQSLVSAINIVEGPLIKSMEDAVTLQRNGLIFIVAVLMLSAASAWWLMDHWIIKPLSALGAALKTFNIDAPASPMDGSHYSSEFAEVIGVFNASAERLARTTVSRNALEQEVKVRQRAEEDVRDAYAKLQKSQAQMVQMEKLSALGTLVGGVAHEINNPLMGLSGYIDFGIENSPAGRTKAMLQKARGEVNRIQRLVKNMLIFARIRRVGASDRCKVKLAIKRSLDLMNADFKRHEIEVTTNAPDADLSVACDEDNLQQALLNLLINARDALAGAGLPRVVTIDVSVDKVQYVSLTVSDNGPGISEESRQQIFTPFFTTKPPGQGTGLGLAVSHQMIAAAGGELTLAPACSGAGACFIIRLNLAGSD